MTSSNDLTVIATASALDEFLRTIAAEPSLGVDTESNSLFAYRERVCLVQISTARADYIIDPLAVDITPLGTLLANPAQQKIFHAAEYDVLCLTRDYGFTFANLFDTVLAARTLGWEQYGLGAILETRFGVLHNKKYQRANWGERPLTREQLEYARLDTRYLIPLRDQLVGDLQAAGRLDEVGEEFQRLARLKGERATYDPHAFWYVSGARELKPPQAAVLRALHHYRESRAERLDRPPFKIISDATLLAIAQALPRTLEGLGLIQGMTPHQVQRHGPELLRQISLALETHPPRPPRTVPEPEEIRLRYEKLRQWRKQKAQARGVESDVILPREALWELARRAPATLEALTELEHLGPWRRGQYGAELLELLMSDDGRQTIDDKTLNSPIAQSPNDPMTQSPNR